MTTTKKPGRRPTKRRAGGASPQEHGAEPAAVLSVDPPWEHDDELGRRGARAKYSTMSTDELCQMDLPPAAERHVLFLWRLANMPQDALNVCRAWMFEPLAELVWEKLRPCQVCAATGRVDAFRIGGDPAVMRDGEAVLVPGSDNRCPACRGKRGEEFTDDELGSFPAWMGMGTTVRNAHETCIIARPVDGRAPERLNLDVRSYFAAPMLVDIDGELPESNGRKGALVHSAKPDEYFAIVERLYPGPYVELFGRRSRPGWRVVGDQDDKLDRVAHKFRVVWPQRVREERLEAARRRARA